MADEMIWLPCLEAVALVDAANPHDAMRRIADRAARGIVRARAEMMITSTRRYRGSWSKPIRERDAEVPEWYWAKCGDADHPLGPHIIGQDMHGQGNDCGQLGLEAKVEIFGVHFAKTDILPMAQEGSGPQMPLPKAKGGAPRDSEKWDAVTIALVRLANEGRLDRAMDNRFPTQAAMSRAVLDDPAVSTLGVSEDTIKALIRKVFQAMLA